MKKLLSVILSVILLFSCMPIGVFAIENMDTTAILTVDSTYASVGGTVEVDVVIANNPGVAGATLSIDYDENLKLISADSGEAFSALDFSGNEVETFLNPSKFSWDSESGEATQNGVILKLIFAVSENAEYNSRLEVSVSYRDGDVYSEENDLTLEIVNGYVAVVDYIPGDLYEDGIINMKDVRLIRQLINGNLSMDVNEAAADVNDDGVVNTKDTRLLRRYINGVYGVELKPSTPRCEHSLTATYAKEAECTVDGNIAYWYCSKCEKYFSDAEGENEISYADTVIAETGHTEVVDKAVAPDYENTGLTEGSHCSVCNEVLIAQQTVSILPAEYGAVTYNNLVAGCTIPVEYMQYAKHEGIELPTPSVAGYRFLGWYVNDSGDPIKRIEADTDITTGTPATIDLYAKWELITYHISYEAHSQSDNPTEYTVESGKIILKDAVLKGFLFDYWTDQDGNMITEIPKGSTGDITLTANWKSMRNMAVPVSELPNPKFEDTKLFDIESNQFTFVYYLGELQNVPLTTVYQGAYAGAGKVDTTQTQDITITSEEASSITKAVENVTSNTKAWSRVDEWSENETNGRDTTHKVGLSIGIDKIFEISGEASTTTQWNKTTTTGWTESDETVDSYSQSNAEEYTTELLYSNTASTSVTYSVSLDESAPAGNYRLVTTGTVHVFGAVTYDATTDSYSVWTFSMLGAANQGLMLDYSQTSNFDDCTGELPFEIPSEVNDFANSLTDCTDGLKFTPYTVDGVTYCTATLYNGTATDVVIPSYYKGMRVTGISPTVFSGNTSITSVSLGEYITEIPASSFAGCGALQTVEMPNVTAIGNNAFNGCTSLNIALPEGINSIGNNAFTGCTSMTSIYLTEELTSLGEDAFLGCDALSLSIMAATPEMMFTAIDSGAKNISINLTELEGTLDGRTITVSDNTGVFELDGAGKTFGDLHIVSEAEQTIIRNLIIGSFAGDTAMEIYSADVLLDNIKVTSDNVAVQLNAADTELLIGGTVMLTSKNEIALICNNLFIDSADDELRGEFRVDQTYDASGAVTFTDMVDVYPNPGNVGTVIYDPCGGEVEYTYRPYTYGYPIGTIPTPTRTGYTFQGWYTEQIGGTQIISTTIMAEDITTLYAHWDANIYSIEYYTLTQDNTSSYEAEIINSNAASFTYGGTLSFSNPVRSKYDIFQGWYADAGFTILVDDVWIENWYNNPTNITLYAKWDLAVYYNDTETTPSLSAYADRTRIVVDWSKYTGSKSYAQSVLEIAANVTEVYFIGSSGAEFNNVDIVVNGDSLKLHFLNFKFEGSLTAKQANSTDIIVDCAGTNYLHGSIEGFDDVTFTGSGTMEIHGQDGADGTTAGEDGTDGATAIIATNLTIDMTGSLNVYGGNGGDGADGAKGNDGTTTGEYTFVEKVSNGWWDIQSIYRYNQASAGENGGMGGNGGNGGIPIVVATLNAISGQIQFVYGDGGAGGDGGQGHNCYGYIQSVDYLHFWNPGKGGNAGNGGNGGNAGRSVTQLYTFESDLITVVSGTDGTPGVGGNPGEVGTGGNGGYFGSGTNNRSAGAASDGEPGVSGDDGVVS